MESSTLVGWDRMAFYSFPPVQTECFERFGKPSWMWKFLWWGPTVLKLRSLHLRWTQNESFKSESCSKLIWDEMKISVAHKNNPNISMTIILSDTANLFAHWIFQIDLRQLIEHGRNGWFGSSTMDIEWFAQRCWPIAYIALDDSLLIFGWDIWGGQCEQRQRVPTLHFIFMWVVYGENGQNGKFKPPPRGPKHRGGP